jgi:hypothetical protein
VNKGELRPFVEKYVGARTTGMARPLAGMLLGWLLLDCFVMYFVFSGGPMKRAAMGPATVVGEADDELGAEEED